MTEYPDDLPSMATMLREQKEEIERLRKERDALAEKLERAVGALQFLKANYDVADVVHAALQETPKRKKTPPPEGRG